MLCHQETAECRWGFTVFPDPAESKSALKERRLMMRGHLQKLVLKARSKFLLVTVIILAAASVAAVNAWAEELYYDDGYPEFEYRGDSELGNMHAVKFTVTDPVAVTGVKLLGSVVTGTVKIHIWNQDLQEVYVKGGYDFLWWAYKIDLSSEDIPVLSGNFYVGLECDSADCVYILGLDYTYPDGRSYISNNGELGSPVTNYDNMIRVFVEPADQTQEVSIDIKFCGDPNAFHCKRKGVLPVTIFGSEGFDVTNIDLESLQLCTMDGGAVYCTSGPLDYSLADRGNPDSDLGAVCPIDELTGEQQDYLNPDGYLDLDVAFDAGEIQDMLYDFCAADKGEVSGALFLVGATLDGTAIESVPIGNSGIDQLLKQDK